MTAVLIDRVDAVACLTLNRPDLGNAIDMDLARELFEAASKVAMDKDVRCVVLTGAGRMFCAGGDIGAFADADNEPGPFLQSLADMLHKSVRVLTSMDKPLLTMVNGPAAGAGLSLALLGDVVIAANGAHFSAAYIGVGLTPDGGMSWLLPRLIGLRRAQDMILLNRKVSADEAAFIGLITRAVKEDELRTTSDALASQLAAGPTAALGVARTLIRDAATRALSDHLDYEARAISAAGQRTEGREGVNAFLQRRPPVFRNVNE